MLRFTVEKLKLAEGGAGAGDKPDEKKTAAPEEVPVGSAAPPQPSEGKKFEYNSDPEESDPEDDPEDEPADAPSEIKGGAGTGAGASKPTAETKPSWSARARAD